MIDKQTAVVIDALNRLPETATLFEITEELQIMSAVKREREDILAERSKSHEEVTQLIET